MDSHNHDPVGREWMKATLKTVFLGILLLIVTIGSDGGIAALIIGGIIATLGMTYIIASTAGNIVKAYR